ncbi:MAG: hypothetical protein AABW53_01370 [Nanoarchaeota archaeon]
MTEKGARLEVIAGTMFGGKSSELIRRIKRHEILGRKVQVFGPSIDTRYGKIASLPMTYYKEKQVM